MGWKNLALVIACASLMVGFAFAQGTDVPGDSDGDKIVSAEELAAAEKLAKEGKLSADELEEIRHIHEKYPITIIDSANRTVMIYKPVKTIIPMSATNCEPIFILGAADKIAGMRTDLQQTYAYIPGITDRPTIGGWKEIDYEKIIKIRPDIVITGSSDFSIVEDKLGPAGIPFIISSRVRNQDSFDKDLMMLAKILEKDDHAIEFFFWRQNYLDQLKEKTDKIDPKDKIRVYCESNARARSAATNASGAHWAIVVAGGYNMASNVSKSTYADVESEWILKENPEAIVIAATMLNDPPGSYLDPIQEEDDTRNLDKYIEMICNRTELIESNAVKMNRVYLLHGTYADFGRCFLGACYMAKWFYPETFEDLNPDEINREYCEKWLGVPYKGIWAYPKAS